MTKVIKYSMKHLEDDTSVNVHHSILHVDEFDKTFVNVHYSILHALILTVNFLNELVDRIKGKTLEEICKEFDVNNDFIHEEEEDIHKENAWVFE
uniref:SKP1 component dimerisation domain-containing protein n=1 Tax=Solanum lycopersicum TaxID=4081 RepID=A0A3Q7GP02_SOLLC